jgi:hypothetical protein
MKHQSTPKVKRPKEDLERQLREQAAFLRRSAAAYDQGFEGEAKRLATVIRVLLHDTSQSKSLLSQLRLKELMLYEDTSLEIRADNLLPTIGLAVMEITRDEMGTTTARYVAPLGELNIDRRHDPKSFSRWWETPVSKDKAGNRFSRKKLVLTASNQEGGAHIDPELDAAYDALSRQNSMGWIVKSPTGEGPPLNDVALASIRQIAFEVDRTLAINLPHLLGPRST